LNGMRVSGGERDEKLSSPDCKINAFKEVLRRAYWNWKNILNHSMYLIYEKQK